MLHSVVLSMIQSQLIVIWQGKENKNYAPTAKKKPTRLSLINDSVFLKLFSDGIYRP
jgi:hypothetical protein